MNGQTICRELMDNEHRCGLLWGHSGPHRCCTLHNRPAPSWQNERENY